MDHEPALRDVATSVDVPGAPYSLRLDDVTPAGDRIRLAWSFVDLTGETERLHGSTTVGGHDAAAAWRAAQLDAAHRLRSQLDLDTRPGEPYVPLRYDVDEAWRLLVEHLGRWDARVVETCDGVDLFFLDDEQEGREIRSSLRGDRASWATYLNQFADDPQGADRNDGDWVPTAVPADGGLPLWATDELTETIGAWDHVRVDGYRLVAIRD